MQIKEVSQKRGAVLQLLRYTGYNKDKKRAEVEYIGSMSKFNTAPPADLVAMLDGAEVAQLNEYLTKIKIESEARSLEYDVLSISGRINKAAAAIDNGINPTDPGKIYAAMKALAAALRKRGHPAPKMPGRGRPRKAQPAL